MHRQATSEKLSAAFGSDYQVGQHVTVKPPGGGLVEAEIKAVIETTEGKRLQVSFGEETARIHLWQVVERLRYGYNFSSRPCEGELDAVQVTSPDLRIPGQGLAFQHDRRLSEE